MGNMEQIKNDGISGNNSIEKAIERFHIENTKENLIAVLESIRIRMHEGGQFILPVIPPEAAMAMFDIDKIHIGETYTITEDLHFKIHHLQTNDLIVVFNIIIINILEYVLLDEKENFDVGQGLNKAI